VDLLTVIDGRAAIVQEIANVASLRYYIAEQFLALLKTDGLWPSGVAGAFWTSLLLP